VRQGRGADAWSELRGGILLGTDEFVDGLKPFLPNYEALREIPHRERLATRPSLDELFPGVYSKKDRNRQIYATIRAHEYTLQAVADFLRLHYSTISVIAKRVQAETRVPKVKI
jgi:putative transposase